MHDVENKRRRRRKGTTQRHAKTAIVIRKMMTYKWIYEYTICGENPSPWVGSDLESQELRCGYSQPPCPENRLQLRVGTGRWTNRNMFSLTEPQFSGILIRLMR
jgi:hypothetical protein